MSHQLANSYALNHTNSFPSVQVAAQSLETIYAHYPYLQAIMSAISDGIEQKGPHVKVKSPFHKRLITYGAAGVNSYFSFRSLFIQPDSKLYTQLDFDCSSRGNVFTKLGAYLRGPAFWAANGDSDPFSFNLKIFEIQKNRLLDSKPQKLLHLRCKTSALPKLSCTSSLTEKMRTLYPVAIPPKTPREEEFRLLAPYEHERPIDIIVVKAMITDALKSLRTKNPS